MTVGLTRSQSLLPPPTIWLRFAARRFQGDRQTSDALDELGGGRIRKVQAERVGALTVQMKLFAGNEGYLLIERVLQQVTGAKVRWQRDQ